MRLPTLLTTWDFRPDVIGVLVVAGLLFTAGWLRLRVRGQLRLAAGWRLAAFLGGLTLLAVALMSALDVWGADFFFVHMIQHLVMVMIVPPLLLLANPFPFVIWGLPGRRQLGQKFFSADATLRRALRWATRPALVWFAFVAILWGWHDPRMYSAAQGSGWVHDAEHVTFFGTAMLLWWHVVRASPRIHSRLSQLARAGYLVAAGVANMIPGVIIALADAPLYPYYIRVVPRLGGMSVIEDQVLAGIIMWIPGTMMYVMAALIIIIRALSRSESQANNRNRLLRQVSIGLASAGADSYPN
ncbi:MAG: cytochrome c oxidase assembly protein [Anaerolineales bacterium]